MAAYFADDIFHCISIKGNFHIQFKSYCSLFPIDWQHLDPSKHYIYHITLKWHHDVRDGVSNHQPHDCLLNRLFRCRSKTTSKLCVTGFVRGIHRWPVNSPHKRPVTRKIFPFDDVIMIWTYFITGGRDGGWYENCMIPSVAHILLVVWSFDRGILIFARLTHCVSL